MMTSASPPSSFGAENREALETLMTEWVAARDFDQVLGEFEQVDAAIAPVLNMDEIFEDPHFGVVMQGLVARFDLTPGKVRHVGPPRQSKPIGWLDRSSNAD